jgi:DNA-binding response OmpR family regulator
MTKRILVIDDEEAIRKSFLLAFEDTEYQMDVAESGERGIQMKKDNKYDLIYLDLKMPGRNGVETLREIRKTDKKIPIYIVTAFYEEFFDQLKSAEEGGINFDVLRKPVDADEILLVTKSVLEGPIGH